MSNYFVKSTAADQGVVSDTRCGPETLKDIVDFVGTTNQATVVFESTATGATTYILTTSETVPSNITSKIWPGAVIDGAGTLTINGPIKAGRHKIFGSSITVVFGPLAAEVFYPEWFGDVDGTADEVQINKATSAAKTNGGKVKLAAKTYVTAATINVYDAVYLKGAGDAFNSVGTGCTGTVIDNGANVPAITVSGDTGFRFQLSDFHIAGNSGTDDGIYLVQSNSKVPRSSRIFNISMYDVGRDGIRFDTFSYVTVDQVIVNTAGAQGFHVIDVTTGTQEFLYMKNCTAQACVDSGLRITTGTYIYVDKCDFTLNAKGIYISGNPYHLHFNDVNLSSNTSYGLEISADTASIARMYFKDLSIYMAGASATEKAIYTHRTGAYTITDTSFNGVEIGKAGATAPTTAIDIDTTFLYSELLRVRNTAGGLVTFPTDQQFVYTDTQKINIATLADDATPTVSGGRYFLTGGTTTITDFDDGYRGQVITIIAEHSLDITDGTNIFLSGSATWSMTATDTLTLICKADNKWYEIARSDSGA